MESEEFDDSETKLSNGDEPNDNTWQFKSVPEEDADKLKMEKERYDEVIEYIREVDEILNLIRPFPREGTVEKIAEPPSRSESQSTGFGLNHLENIIKLVEQLKELQENNYKFGERTCYLKDLKKLREHKKRLKNEELLMRSRGRVRSVTSPEEYETCLANRKSSSTSEKFEPEPKETWQNKRKSICLGENRSKVSKWTKVKEAFHWEKTSLGLKKEFSREDKDVRDQSPEDVFCPPPSPPPPPLPPPRPENLLSVRPPQDLPSSSSSDRLDDFLSFSETLKENKPSDPDSPTNPFGAEDIEEAERKLSCEEIPPHLSKEEFAMSRSTKSNKTAWGKVKDIIQTRKDSLKKKPKKRGSDEFKKRRKLSTVSNPMFSDQFEDLSSPEEKVKNTDLIPKTPYEYPEEALPLVEEKSPKRSTPSLTVTLPSTEELCSPDQDKREIPEEPNILSQFACHAQYCEDKSKFGKGKTGPNQRLSRWIKVKRVFLTSAAPPRTQYLPVSASSPSSQTKSYGFFSDFESDDLSSGEWIDDKSSPLQEKPKLTYPDPPVVTITTAVQEDLRKSYNELQKKLSQEFDQKIREWELKSETPPSKQEDPSPKIKGEEGDCIPKFRKTRDSITVPLPNLNDLSPEFKKKLNDWKKMKTSQSSSSVSSSATKDDLQGQNIKIRIGEWQPWRTRCSGKMTTKNEQEEYSKKFEEGQKGCGSARPPSNRKKDDEKGFSSSTNRRSSKRRDSVKKLSHSRTSSGGESLVSTSSAEKDGRLIRRSQKVKDFHWVEKELQKIEREKLRLEQEKEKYLEREARLEKMKKTMGTSPTQEILVRTPEGYIRFKGISQKFTKKLYEWEKARGIAPEASTFALLEASAQTGTNGDSEGDGVAMQRSKSTGSVPELTTALLIQSMAHHPSSLSLNDVDELITREEDLDEELPLQRLGEPEAIIVDVEDIVEETAVLAEASPLQSETPVYTYTSEEIDKLTEARGRFYLSGGFDVKNTEEEDATEIKDNFLESLENKRIIMAEGATKTFQDADEMKGIEDAFQIPAEENSSFDKSKSKGMETKKTEPPLITRIGSIVPVPTPERSFSHWMDEELSSGRTEIQELSFEKKSAQTKPDSDAIKKKIKEKISLMQKMSTEASWKYNEFEAKKAEEEGGTKFDKKTDERLEGVLRRHYVGETSSEKVESISVFVPTTRKIISPVKTTKGATPSVCSYVIDDVKPEVQEKSEPKEVTPSPPNKSQTDSDLVSSQKRDIGMPPLPNSPKLFKKLNSKETAPSIRMIIAKYNQKISEGDNNEGKRTESGSPIWRSPVFGRRTQEKIDRYCGKDEGRKNGEVQKSVSLDNVRGNTSKRLSLTPPQETQIKGILKSNSAGIMRIPPQNHDPGIDSPPPDVTTFPDAFKETSPSALRALKIRKAKEDFLSGRLGNSSDASSTSAIGHPPNAETQISTTESEDNQEQNLTKSVSAETITGETSRSETRSDNMPDARPLQKSSSKFDISSIKSKFRKMRMKKDKDPKLNAVAALCRQSLFIEVPKTSESSSVSKSCPSSPVMDRSKHDKSSQPPKKR